MKKFVYMFIDFIILFVIAFFVDSITADYHIVVSTDSNVWLIFLVIITMKIIFNYFFGVYDRSWALASFEDYLVIGYSFMISNIIVFIPVLLNLVPISMITFFALMFCESVAYIGTRFYIRFYSYINNLMLTSSNAKNTLIIGAGQAGDLAYRDVSKNPKRFGMRIIGFVDDDPNKIGSKFKGKPVFGPIEMIKSFIDTYAIDVVIIAVPSLSNSRISELVKLFSEYEVEVKLFSTLSSAEPNKGQIRNVSVDDLLGRDPVLLKDTKLDEFFKEEVVLITGGGGSIGSEIARQVSELNIKRLVIFDIYENNAYDLQMSFMNLHRIKPEIELPEIRIEIGSVQDYERLEEVYTKYTPTIVFHAAAHKHVPLMEYSPKEAIKNNVKGTYYSAKLADKYDVNTFVLVSTDKAVNPTNIMGASKRMAELIIQSYSRKSKTKYCAVRFGNVLGSNGSVIPLFESQIRQGGPVTVTHRDIIRYFMTIPEACQLVLNTACLSKGGEIFILDMGDPVKILDLAERMIRLSGLRPYEDISIEFTGLRPGEKMFEELLLDDTQLTTANKRIFIDRDPYIDFDIEETIKELLSNPKSIFDVIKTKKISNESLNMNDTMIN